MYCLRCICYCVEDSAIDNVIVNPLMTILSVNKNKTHYNCVANSTL